MKKDILIVAVGAILGSAATFGINTFATNYLKIEDPLTNSVAELSHVGKELLLEQKSLNEKIAQISMFKDVSPQIQVELNEVINRVNNIVATSMQLESTSREVSGVARSMSKNNSKAKFNASADLILSYGQAVTVCGNENTLGIETERGRDAVIYINDMRRNASVGEEFKFVSPMGPSLVSYLGKNSEQYQFRIVCGTTVKKA